MKIKSLAAYIGVILSVPLITKASILSETEYPKNFVDFEIYIKANELIPSIYSEVNENKSTIFDFFPIYEKKSQDPNSGLEMTNLNLLTLFKIKF